MNKMTIIFVSLLSLPVFAGVTTADRIGYNILLDERALASEIRNCVNYICKLSEVEGQEKCTFFAGIGVVSATLDSKAVTEVSKLKCVTAVEVDGVVEPLPSVGRRN